MVVVEETFADRLKVLIGEQPANRFAREVKIGESLLRKYLAGAVPGIDKVAQIAQMTGTSVEWLVTGNRRSDGPSTEADLSLIQRLDVDASAGLGALVEDERNLDFVAFQTRWLRRKGINPSAVRILNIRGDSMEPTLRDGDIALVDTSIEDIIDNAIYVLLVGNRLLIKRIHILISGALRLISDNPVYPHEDIPANEAEFVRVSGRVVWYGRSI
ncbi:S24 family peptidase [Neorhizobium galegae]|nr:helix-turn-helix transcriptional regulator [Neorhizobium galegae]